MLERSDKVSRSRKGFSVDENILGDSGVSPDVGERIVLQFWGQGVFDELALNSTFLVDMDAQEPDI